MFIRQLLLLSLLLLINSEENCLNGYINNIYSPLLLINSNINESQSVPINIFGNLTINIPNNLSLKYVSVGDYQACGLDDLNHIWCFGACGLNLNNAKEDYYQEYQMVSVAQKFGVCAINLENNIACFGCNPYNIEFNSTKKYKQVSLGDTFGCVLTFDGYVECSGFDPYQDVIDKIPQDVKFKKIEVGSLIFCGILDSNSYLYCVGSNNWGQISGSFSYPRNIVITELFPFLEAWTCVLDIDGNPICFGDNYQNMKPPQYETNSYIYAGTANACYTNQNSGGTAECYGKPFITDLNANESYYGVLIGNSIGVGLLKNKCTPCPPGAGSNKEQNKCIKCMAGKYSSNFGDICHLCEEGYYCTGDSVMHNCSAGFYCKIGSSKPTLCTLNCKQGEIQILPCTSKHDLKCKKADMILPYTLIIITICIIILILIACKLMLMKFPESKPLRLIQFISTIIDLISDILFIIHVYKFNLYWQFIISLLILCVSCFVYTIIVVKTLWRWINISIEFRQFCMDHAYIVALILFISCTGMESLLILNSRIFNLDAFSAPSINQVEEEKFISQTRISVLCELIPQFIIQVIVSIQLRQLNGYVGFALLISCIQLIIIIVRWLLYICVKNKTMKHELLSMNSQPLLNE